MMKRFYKRVLLVLLAVSLVLPTLGCKSGGYTEPPKKIPIEQDPAYSAETLIWAEETIFSLMVYTYRIFVMDAVSEVIEARLKSYAHRVCQITAAKPIPEEQYRAVITLLSEDGKAVVDELFEFQKSGAISYEKARALYLEFVYAFGAHHVASMVYDGCLLIYDAQYETAMERFETYPYPWYQEEANAIAAEKAIFANGIQKESFATLFRCTTAMAELLAVSPDGMSEMFSDTEMVDMIRRLDPSEIDISKEGWELLLSKVLRPESGSYFATLVDAFKENGDLARVSYVMNDAMQLLASVLKNLAPEDIASIRTGNWGALLSAICSRFDDEDWDLFTSVTSVALANEQYSALATQTYTDSYLTYLQSIEKISIEQLRQSVGSDAFSQNLFNYFAAICPAISYEVNS